MTSLYHETRVPYHHVLKGSLCRIRTDVDVVRTYICQAALLQHVKFVEVSEAETASTASVCGTLWNQGGQAPQTDRT